MRKYFSVKELAGLAGMPTSVPGVHAKAKREGWESRKRAKSKGLEYPLTSLPIETRRAVASRAVEQQIDKQHITTNSGGDFPSSLTPAEAPRSGFAPQSGGTYSERVETVITDDPSMQSRCAEAAWRYDVIAPALAFRGSERRAAVRAIAAHTHSKNNKPKSVSYPTAYRWIKLYEKGGMQGLMPKPRKDAGTHRLLISREWDKACKLDRDVMQKITNELVRYMRSLWASGSPSERKVQRLATAKLQVLCEKAGWITSREICTVGRRLINNERRYRLVAIADSDASKLYNDFLPPILRTKDGLLPGDLVVGDVHPLDIYVRREDPKTGKVKSVCPKLVAWLDVATMLFHCSLVLCAPGESIRREHVGLSFPGIVNKVGIPKVLYEDNGSEYDWRDMLDAWGDLARMTGRMQSKVMDADVQRKLGSVTKALPYNARAKNIEGIFSVLERTCFSQMKGWIGGQRMNKKTANQGKEPDPFPGTWEEFHRQVDITLEDYHTTPQSGLGGKSPNEKLAEFRAQGWQPIAPGREALLMSFAEVFEPVVRSGRFNAAGNIYHADELVSYSDGGRIKVRVQRHDPSYAFCFDGRELICVAGLEKEYGWLEQAGASEAGRRRVAMRRTVSAMKHHCDRLDLVEETAIAVGYDDKEAVQDNITMLPGADTQKMLQAVRQQLKEADQQKSTNATLSQWGEDNDDDPYLKAVQ